MNKIQDFCYFALAQLKEHDLHIALSEEGEAHITDIGTGTELTDNQVIADVRYMNLLMGYVSTLYKMAIEEYNDDATR